MIACIEGVDLTGKGTQVKLLKERLNARVIKFPNAETYTGKVIYEHLRREWEVRFNAPDAIARGLTPGEEAVEAAAQWMLDATVFQALQTVNRLELAPEIARYKGTHGEWLVLDRYWPSGVVFGGADGLDEEWLLNIHRSLPQPDYFVLLDMDLEHVTARFKKLVETGERKPDRYEADERVANRIALYRKLWAMPYGELAPWKEGSAWRVVDARREPELVYQDVLRALLPKRVV